MNQDVLIIASSKIVPTVGRFFIHTENRPTKVCNQIIHHNRSEAFDKSHTTFTINTNQVLTSTSLPIPVNTNTTIHSPTLINSSFISHSLLEGGRVKNINLGRSATHSGSCALTMPSMNRLKRAS